MKQELSPPPDTDEAASAHEILRAWVVDTKLQISLRPAIWQDTRTWGLLLADAARHVANAIEESHGTPADAVLAGIRETFNVELSFPTDTPFGEFVS